MNELSNYDLMISDPGFLNPKPRAWITEPGGSGAWALPALLALLLFAVAGLVRGQGIRIDLADGRAVQQIGFGVSRLGNLEAHVLPVDANRTRLELRDLGNPETDLATLLTNGERFLFTGIGLGVPPGWRVEWAAERGARPAGFSYLGLDVWSAVDLGSYRPANWRNLPGTGAFFWLEGGQSLWYDLIRGPDTVPSVSSAAAARVASCFGWDSRYDPASFPRVEQLRRTFTDGGTNFPDVGTWLRGWHVRFTANADGTTRLPSGLNWYDWGASIEAADGHTNSRYGLDWYCLERFLATGDPAAWRMARLLVSHKVQAGLIRTKPGPVTANRWRYESGFQDGTLHVRGTVGDQQPPKMSHEWDAGLFGVAALAPEDPDLADACGRRAGFLLTDWTHPPAGQRAPTLDYGARFLGWHLSNLWHAWKITGDARFRNAAEHEVARVWSMDRPGEAHWYDPQNPTSPSPWQEMLLDTSLAVWGMESVGLEHGGRLLAFMRWAVDNGTYVVKTARGDYLQTAMQIGSPTVWQQAVLTSFALPVTAILARYDDRYVPAWEAARRTVADGLFQIWNPAWSPGPAPVAVTDIGKPLAAGEAGVWSSAYGSAGLKEISVLSYGLRQCWLVPPR